MPPLQYFSVCFFCFFFFQKNSNFCDVQRRLDNFQSHLKENIAKVKEAEL